MRRRAASRVSALLCLALALAGCAQADDPTAGPEWRAPNSAPTEALTPAPSATASPVVTTTPTLTVTPTVTVTPPPTKTPTPAFASRLLYVSGWDGDPEIYRIDVDGANPAQLTDSDAAETDPAWSPDGTRIAYTSTWWGDPDIFLMNADGGEVLQITRSSGADTWPAWSPDGRWLVFASDRGRVDRFRLYRVPADCRAPGDGLGVRGAAACEAQVEQVTHAPGATDVYPAWSPGERILFASDQGGVAGFDIYSVLPGEEPRRLIGSVHTDWFARWSPDGKWIAFASGGDEVGFQIYVADRDGANIRQITFDAAALKGFPVWSPDGTKLAYVAAVDGVRDVYVINAAGGEPVRLTDDGQVIAVGDWALALR